MQLGLSDLKKLGGLRQNHGVPGVVYILENPGITYLKIGCSRHSGAERARQLNQQAKTAIPKQYRCVFEAPTQDCGLAEERVFDRLAEFRRGGRGQEFFEIDLENAKYHVKYVCQQLQNDGWSEVLRVPSTPYQPKPLVSVVAGVLGRFPWLFLVIWIWLILWIVSLFQRGARH